LKHRHHVSTLEIHFLSLKKEFCEGTYPSLWRARNLWFLLLCPLFLMGSFGLLWAQEINQEYQLKAAFLVNFARFITWPVQSFPPEHQEITFCIAEKNPFGITLDAVENKKINGRNIRVVYTDSFQKLPQCHLFFVGRSESNDIDSLLSRISKKPVVTVSDIPGFVNAGGSIEFVIKEDRLSFIINNSDLKQRGIQASASMLDLATSAR
jgi:hypothetical protein